VSREIVPVEAAHCYARRMRRYLLLMIALMFALAACKSAGDFTYRHGVAAGDVTSTSAVLWTRAEGAGGPPLIDRRGERTFAYWPDVRVTAQVSSNPSFQSGVLSFEGMTSGDDEDFTVQMKATGLAPDTRYYYRFRAGGAVSETGTFVTAPDDASSKPLRFVYSGDSDGTRDRHGDPVFNTFEVLDAASAEDPAFFLYLGDTIYADHGGLRDERPGTREAKYRQNREYDALADILRQTSVIAMWDDHEVYNDFAGDQALSFDEGRDAFRRYFPLDLPESLRFRDSMHRSMLWGADAELIVLDTRSRRDFSAALGCGNDPLPAGALPDAPETLRGVRAIAQLPPTLDEDCLHDLGEPRTMLGADQKEWLFERLRESDATWKIVATSVPMQALLFAPYDRWEGYSAERREVLEFIRDNDIRNVVFLSTDLHANIFGPVRIDPFVETAPLAYEAIVGPIAAETLEQDIVNVLGAGGAGLLDAFLTGIVGVDCAQLNSFAYGLVEVDGDTLTTTAKDESGRELCTKTLEAE
jgi:alkaline phosphatase D